ncbi:LOW QUALITY PROTEIN: FAST kinase domain-containing protein 4-like [Ctenocephalides felis]|uniref:LOW QUALITY PROTEIN: FAST kinase domain-containing protein 4-like n=1 Tax=Ctenocephalides felis TaxID=7515 RepID=UPI000E6E35DB|nr:LOW QUALITY PROTEIN: FAST kinase domain-containing protein 4-like [Ctenocephalides felis]
MVMYISKMLQILNLTRRGCMRTAIYSHSASTAATIIKPSLEKNEANNGDRKIESYQKNSGSMIAAAFASLNDVEQMSDNKTSTKEIPLNSKPMRTFDNKTVTEKIKTATSVNELLATTENNSVSRQNALRIVSTLAEWTTTNKIKLNEFESDPRFLKLCRVIGRANSADLTDRKTTTYTRDDLNTLLEVTGDDEAAKLIATISLPQMIKVMSTLAQQKKRSKPLLHALAYNITRNTDALDLKQCADILYSISVLNYPDHVLLSRVCSDISAGLNNNKDKSAVVGSILTSFGLLKYKDTDTLESLSEWILKYNEICRSRDISVLIVTLAVLNHKPTNFEQLMKTLLPHLTHADHPNPTEWLNVVWSLVCLDKCPIDKIEYVFSDSFYNLLNVKNDLTYSAKMKLLNIKAAADILMPDKIEAKIDIDKIKVQHKYSNSKQIMINSVLDALKSLFASEQYLRSMINTDMGFLIDAECVLDKNCNPLPLTSNNSSGIRIAMQVLDYHDMCQNLQEPHGAVALSRRLLEARGYKVLCVPYTEYQPSDKLIKRVQYLESKLKQIVNSAKQV